MSKINTPPRGLQSFLGNTNFGVNPADLSPVVVPTVDAAPFLSSDFQTQKVVSSSVVGTIGQGIDMLVPAGESWIPIAVSGQYFVAVGNTRQISVRLVDPSGGILVILTNGRIAAATIAAEVTCGVLFPQRILLTSGWSFRVQIDESDSAIASQMECNLSYIRLKT